MRIVLKCSTFGSNAYPISRAEALELYCKEVMIPVAVQSRLPIPERYRFIAVILLPSAECRKPLLTKISLDMVSIYIV